ncbi:MAG TPA: hypothetical protein VKW08_15800, partial [Xanthobacteraceae bacterium]|nr:hypothetical protein [Xanthobacteraceae bacterium]
KSIACRHPAMAKLLVSSITDEESTKILPVPSGFAYQENPDSWNRSSRWPEAPGQHGSKPGIFPP